MKYILAENLSIGNLYKMYRQYANNPPDKVPIIMFIAKIGDNCLVLMPDGTIKWIHIWNYSFRDKDCR